ncbi:transposase [Streptomyces sp. NPDC096046]|uniref:transposase n=1 Tax=Streptomyces sp. NPDC096046 TaxID=3155542 RepID=UPI003318364B
MRVSCCWCPARLLATGGDRKTDAKDALHVAQVALFRHDLRPVVPADQTTILRLLTERRDDLVHERTRVLNRLHAVLRDLLPGGAPTGLSADKAAALMKGIRPVTATDNCRRDIARDLLADLRRLDRQVKDNEAEMREAVAATRTTLTTLPGLGTVLAAKVLGHIGDISRLFPTEHHFASYTGSAPLDASSGNNVRHRLNTGGNRALNSVLHTIAVCQIRDGGRTGLLPPQDRRGEEPLGGPQGPQATPVQRGLPDHETRPTEPPRSSRLTHRGAIRSCSARPEPWEPGPGGRTDQSKDSPAGRQSVIGSRPPGTRISL